MTDFSAGRASYALVALCGLLVIAGCGGSDGDGGDGDQGQPNNPSMQGVQDGGGSSGSSGSDSESTLDGGNAPSEVSDAGGSSEVGRVGPDGAVQVREEPEETGCARASAASGYYWFCENAMPSSVAAGACWGAGGTLVVINDTAENDFLVGEMVSDVYSLGFSDAGEEGAWVWADGSGPDFENWADMQPGLDDFAVITRETGLWSTGIDDPRPYICEDWK